MLAATHYSDCQTWGGYMFFSNGCIDKIYSLFLIKMWLKLNAKLTHGHIWGGGVYDYDDTLLRITDYVTPHNRKKNYVRQLVVLYGEGIYYSWIKKGAICQK